MSTPPDVSNQNAAGSTPLSPPGASMPAPPATGAMGGTRVSTKRPSPIALIDRIKNWITGGGWESRAQVAQNLRTQVNTIRQQILQTPMGERTALLEQLNEVKKSINQLKGPGASDTTTQVLEETENSINEIKLKQRLTDIRERIETYILAATESSPEESHGSSAIHLSLLKQEGAIRLLANEICDLVRVMAPKMTRAEGQLLFDALNEIKNSLTHVSATDNREMEYQGRRSYVLPIVDQLTNAMTLIHNAMRQIPREG